MCAVVEGEPGSNGGNRVSDVEDGELHLRKCACIRGWRRETRASKEIPQEATT